MSEATITEQNNAEPRADMERIVIDVHAGDFIVRKAFKGRWLASGFADRYFAVEGEHGGLALWVEEDGDPAKFFETYENWKHLISSNDPRAGWPEDFLSVIAGELGEDYAVEIDL